MMRFLQVLSGLLLIACVEPKSPKTGGEFSTAHLSLFAKRVAECSGRDEEAIVSLLGLPDLATRVDHAIKQKRVVYKRDVAAKCLDALAKVDCTALSTAFALDAPCSLALEGQVDLGDDCFELNGDFN